MRGRSFRLSSVPSYRFFHLFATIYVTDMALKGEFNAVWDKWLHPGCAPARVCVEAGLGRGGFLAEVAITAALLEA